MSIIDFRLSAHVPMPVSGPCFTTPIFSTRSNSLWLQVLSGDIIENFHELDHQSDSHIENVYQENRIRCIGDLALFGFVKRDGSAIFGTRKELEAPLTDCFLDLEDRPNTRCAIARFLRSEKLLEIAYKNIQKFQNENQIDLRAIKYLPLLNFIPSYQMKNIMKTRHIYNYDNLIYGCPADDGRQLDNVWGLPIVIALRSEGLLSRKALSINDSIKEKSNVHIKEVNELHKQEEYFQRELANALDFARRQVVECFGSNEMYFKRKYKNKQKDKIHTGEPFLIKYNKSIILYHGIVELIIVPDYQLTVEIANFAANVGANIRTYDISNHQKTGYIQKIIRVLGEYYVEKDFFTEY